MAKIDIPTFDHTLLEIDKILEGKNETTKYKLVAVTEEESPRNYLGMSEIGNECWRKLFYSFRKAAKKIIAPANQRAIEDGYIQEQLMPMRLRLLPQIELYTEDPNNPGEQIAFSLLLGHFLGHCDGMIKGVVEAPQTWHVWEHKSVYEKKFNQLLKIRNEKGEKQALFFWDIVYYAQAQIYMHESKTERHYLTVTTPGGRDYISVRTEYKRKYAEDIIAKAKTIIFDNWMLPPRISEKREFFQCNWCDYQAVCHDGALPDINCRTCRYSEPVKEGQTYCHVLEKNLDDFNACKNHLYNPALIMAKLIEHQKDCCIYEYEGIKFANCLKTGIPELKGDLNYIFTSEELKNKIQYVTNIKPAEECLLGKTIPQKKAWD